MDKWKKKLLEKLKEKEEILFLGKADNETLSFLSEKNKVTAVFSRINEKNEAERKIKSINFTALKEKELEKKSEFSLSIVFHEDFAGKSITEETLILAGKKTKANGKIYFLGKTSRGAKSFQKTMKKLYGNVKVISVKKGIRLIESVKEKKINKNKMEKELIKQKNKFEFEFNGKKYFFESSSGIFSKNRVDEGTKLLLESIKVKAKKILDFGSGTGIMGVVLAKENPEAEVLMIDSDLKAVFLAEKNIKLNEINNAKVIASDGFKKIKIKFDLIASNPPTHNKRNFLEKFVEESFKHLKQKGKLVIVLNKKVFLEKEIKKAFGNCEITAEGKSHKIIEGKKN